MGEEEGGANEHLVLVLGVCVLALTGLFIAAVWCATRPKRAREDDEPAVAVRVAPPTEEALKALEALDGGGDGGGGGGRAVLVSATSTVIERSLPKGAPRHGIQAGRISMRKAQPAVLDASHRATRSVPDLDIDMSRSAR